MPSSTTDLRANTPWPCLDAARDHDPALRLPVRRGDDWLGSVARSHLGALAAWPTQFTVHDAALEWHPQGDDPSAGLEPVHRQLHAQGLIRAWRDEPYPWLDQSGRRHAVIERAASRFWGALTFGAHCNGHVNGPDGRPQAMWIATRSLDKATDPGRLDNLVGGGVPLGQTPREALLREAWEEAGLPAEELAGLRDGSVLALHCAVREGLQQEWLYVYDLALPPGRVPCNQDGEVAEHRLLPLDEALARAADGSMTVDASLATLDFALRHGLLPPAEAADLSRRLARLRAPQPAADRLDGRPRA